MPRNWTAVISHNKKIHNNYSLCYNSSYLLFMLDRDSGAVARWKEMARDSGALVPFVKELENCFKSKEGDMIWSIYMLFGLCLALPYICMFITLSHLAYLAGDSVAI